MTNFGLTALLLCSVLLLGCESEADRLNDEAKEAVAQTLLDPLSVQIKDVRLSDRTESIICGEVNAKNRFGGYTGFQPFYIERSDSKQVKYIPDKRGEAKLTDLIQHINYCGSQEERQIAANQKAEYDEFRREQNQRYRVQQAETEEATRKLDAEIASIKAKAAEESRLRDENLKAALDRANEEPVPIRSRRWDDIGLPTEPN